MGFLDEVGVDFWHVFEFCFVCESVNIMTVHSKFVFCRTFVGPWRYNWCRRWWAVIVSYVAEWFEIIVAGFREASELFLFCCFGCCEVFFSFFYFSFFLIFLFFFFYLLLFFLLLLFRGGSTYFLPLSERDGEG